VIDPLSDERKRAHMSTTKTTPAQKAPNPTITKVLWEVVQNEPMTPAARAASKTVRIRTL
jgi:hypothetical protein